MTTLLRPRWLAGHALVVVLVGTFVALGFWQLARDRHKHAIVRRDRAAFAAPAPDLETGPAPVSGARVQATGTYDGAHETLLRDQSHGDQLGDDVLTPLRLADGTAVLVDRGWVAAGSASAAPDVAPPATGTVVVRGLARDSRPLSAQDAATVVGGRLSVPRVDLARIGKGLPYRVRGVWIEAQAQQPAPGSGAGVPTLPEPPSPDPVNHLEYAIEWFAFAAIGLIGWPIVLARVTRRRRTASP